MELSIETHIDTVGTDLRWLGSSHGIDDGVTGTLDTTTVAEFKNAVGVLPSGIALGKVTVGGLYGLFDTAATDGREKLAGFLLSDVGVANGATAYAKVGISVLKHGSVKRSKLPVVAQRTSVTDTVATSGQFVILD